MRTSLNEIRFIEKCLLKQNLTKKERKIWESKMSSDSTFRAKVKCQNKVYELVTYLGRETFKKKLDILHNQLMDDPIQYSFQENVEMVFPKIIRK